MRKPLWNMLSSLAAIGAAMAVRQVLGRVWPTDDEPPLNPADRSVPWQQALIWAVASGAGAGLARMLARRGAVGAWEMAFDETPPGVAAG